MRWTSIHHGNTRVSLSEVRAAMAAQDWPRALGGIEVILNSSTDNPETAAVAYHLGGCCFAETGDLDQALTFAQSAVLLRPSNAASWCQLGRSHYMMAGPGSDHYLEAHVCFERALAMAPDVSAALCGFASSLFTFGQHEQAIDLFRRAQRPAPNPKAALAEAGILLRLGRYEEGWNKFESRLLMLEASKTPPYLGTLSDLCDRSVVVRAEQGNGDNLQFMRYIPQLRRFCRSVVVEAYSGLEALLAAFTGEKVVTAPYLANHDTVSINIMSLPLLLAPAIGWEPIPPLPAPTQFAGHRQGIGLCQASTPRPEDGAMAHSMARRKTPPFDLFEHLAKWFGPFRSLLHDDLGTSDWLETATVIAGLDLVVTVDTAVAHLAASLGVETWLVQRSDACWRWCQGWYPNARIFQQASLGDWGTVFRQVHQAMEDRFGLAVQLP